MTAPHSPIPAEMDALVLRHDGFSEGPRTGAALPDPARWLDFARLAVPRPGPGEVLVRMRMASVNPSDLFFVKGEYGQPRRKGVPAGFEGVGEVVAANGLYARLLVGRRVAFVGGSAGSGAWAEYIAAPAALCVPVPRAMRDEDAAGHTVNPVTAWLLFDEIARAGASAFLMTAGNSQLSKLLAGLARDRGVDAIAVVRRESQAAAIRQCGAADVLVAGAPDSQERLARICAERKPRFLLDAVCDPLSGAIFAAMPSGARWIVYGRMGSEPPVISEPGQLIFMNKRIEGFWLSRWFRQASLVEKIRVVRAVQKRFVSGRWKTDVSHRLRLQDALSQLPAALSARDGKVMLVP